MPNRRLSAIKTERQIPTSVEQFHADMRRRFVNPKYDIMPESRTVQGRCRTTIMFGNVRLDHFLSCPESELAATAHDMFELGLTMRGHVRARNIRSKGPSSSEGSGLLITPGQKFDMRIAPGSQVLALTMSAAKVQAAAQSLVGERFKLADLPAFDMARPEAQALLRNLTTGFSELMELHKSGMGELATVAYEDLLVNLAVAAIAPGQHAEAMEQELHAPALVARAEEMLSARAHQAISISEVAAALNVSVRALQMAFRKHRGTTPLQFLISRRLLLAREQLLNSERKCNVQSVAMDCGFLSVSKFSARYRSVFGELPSVTLARQRR